MLEHIARLKQCSDRARLALLQNHLEHNHWLRGFAMKRARPWASGMASCLTNFGNAIVENESEDCQVNLCKTKEYFVQSFHVPSGPSGPMAFAVCMML